MTNTTDADQIALHESIEKEVKNDREHRRKSILDRRIFDTRHDELFTLIASAAGKIEATAPRRLPLYTKELTTRYALIRQASKTYDAAPSGTQRYSDETRDLAVETFEIVTANKELLKERLGYGNIADGIRADCGVGTTLNRLAPHDVLEIGQRQVQAFSTVSTRTLMESREIDVDRLLTRLKPKIDALDASIHAGVGSTVTRGTAADLLDEALLGAEILLSRVVAFCTQYGAKDLGKQLSDRIPRKAAKHVKTKEEVAAEEAAKKKKAEEQAKLEAEAKAKLEAEKLAKLEAELAKK
jgi:hypothetical protein